MNRITPILLLLVLGLATAFVGCDSTDERADDERIVGSWTASQASVDVNTPLGTVPVPVLNANSEGSVTIDFDADGTFTFRVVGPITADFFGEQIAILEDGVDEMTSGTYSVQSDGQIRFGVDGAFDSAANVDYDFSGDDAFDLSVENTEEGRATLAFLLGDSVPQEVLDAVRGGSITFRRDS